MRIVPVRFSRDRVEAELFAVEAVGAGLAGGGGVCRSALNDGGCHRFEHERCVADIEGDVVDLLDVGDAGVRR